MFELRLLGALEIRATDARDVEPLVRRSKRTALLAYLAAALPRGFHRRDKLLALFWPELDEPHARAALSQALYVLRSALGEPAIVTRGDGEVGLSAEVVWCDVAGFEAALDGGRPAEALARYQGDLLDGFFVTGAPEFERWLDAERGRLRQRASEGAWALAEAKAAEGDALEAERWARRAGELLPDDEAVIRRLITFLHRLGDKTAAIRAYEAFARRIAQEHELEPSAETQALAAAIRREEHRPVAPRPVEPVATSPSAVPLARRRVSAGWLGAVTVVALAVLGTLGVLVARSGGSPARGDVPRLAAYERTAIAVLPFQNLSAEGPHAYFAGGLHEEILTQLSKVAALKVISRTSVMGYAGPNTPPLREIASDLGVGSVVEGSVQVLAGRLRVNVQLIDAATDAQLWAETYDRTLDDAFAIQSDVAQQIVTSVGAALSVDERHGLIALPTANAEAYRLYLEARASRHSSQHSYQRQNLAVAQLYLERALLLDPDFALAHAELSEVHGHLYWWRYDPLPARALRQMEEAQAALRVAPDLPQAHIAMGRAYYMGRDWRRALEEFRNALKGLPNDAWVWEVIGSAHRRLGNWNEALAAFEEARRLDPRNAGVFEDIGGLTLHYMHRYPEAVRAYDEALRLAPDFHEGAFQRGLAYLHWHGRLDTLRAVLGRLPPDADLAQWGTRAAQRVQLFFWERQTDSLLQALKASGTEVFEGVSLFLPRSLYAAWAHQLRGDRVAAEAAFDSARVFLDSALTELPNDERLHAARGLVMAGLGRADEALREAQWLQESPTYRDDAFIGTEVAEDRARILAQVGDARGALDEVERLLAMPSGLSVHTLRLDPRWDPIRGNPRFQRLLHGNGR